MRAGQRQERPDMVISGLGHVVITGSVPDATVDSSPYLKQRKTRKFMGLQDHLAVVAAGKAIVSARLSKVPLGERTGLYLVVGYIPFDDDIINDLVEASTKDLKFDMHSFSTTGMSAVSPLMTFRCLPNMPAFHISFNFDIQGPYHVAYPSPGQLYLALEQAAIAIADGRIDRALVGGVAHQQNFLVRHHFRRVTPESPPDKLVDAAGIMVIEPAQQAKSRGISPLGKLIEFEHSYHMHEPFSESLTPSERFIGTHLSEPLPGDCGAASLPTCLSLLAENKTSADLTHELVGRDGITAKSRWCLYGQQNTHSIRTERSPSIESPQRSIKKHRVVITGMGVVTPIGSTVESFFNNLRRGRSGVDRIQVFDPASLPTRIAAEADMPASSIDLRDRKISFALEAARQAMEAANAPGTPPGLSDLGRDASLSLGLGLEVFSMPDMIAYQHGNKKLPAKHRDRLTFLQTPSDICLHSISKQYGLGRPPLAHVSACAAGADAIGAAYELIAAGKRRWMLAGGCDSMINPLGVGGFCSLRATTQKNETPKAASRPFELSRDGFVLGEGAGLVVMERLEDAQARGADISAEVCGYGNSFDAYGITAPHPEGRGAIQAMRRALDSANLSPDAVDCVNAHATGTILSDPVETLAIKAIFGLRAHEIPVTANKSMTGHLISASGAVEAIAAIQCMAHDCVSPTINLEQPDPKCDLDYVPNRSRAHSQQYVLSNSFGFGGMNATLILGKVVNASR
jgi:3-oxoacyl-[acyl-carrier-protein] synthase II